MPIGDTKTSAETTAATLTGSEIWTAVQTAANVKISVAQMAAYLASLTLSSTVAYNVATAFDAFGDSTGTGTGAITPSTDGYVPTLSTARALTVTNRSVSGDQAADQLKLVNAITVANGHMSTLFIGLNDTRQFGANRQKLTTFKRAHMAAVAWLAIPDAMKLKAQGSGIAFTGTWANDAANGNIGKSIAPGTAGTATATVYGSTVYIGYIVLGTNVVSDFTVTVDGVVRGTWSCTPNGGGAIATQNALSYAGALIRIPGLTEDKHTVLISVAAGNTGTVFLDWIGSNLTGPNKDGPNVFVGNLYRLNSTGYAVAPANSSDAVIALANGMIRQNVDILASDGLNVALVDIASRFDPAVHLNADGVHPNNAGHLIVRDAFREPMNQIGRVGVRDRRPRDFLAFRAVTGAYDIDVLDPGVMLRTSDATGVIHTMRVNDYAPIELGSTGSIRQVGAGQVTVSGIGVTLNVPTGYAAKTGRQGAVLMWHKVGPNEFDITGDLGP